LFSISWMPLSHDGETDLFHARNSFCPEWPAVFWCDHKRKLSAPVRFPAPVWEQLEEMQNSAKLGGRAGSNGRVGKIKRD
ncbi:MAG: hypothetical protein M0Q93_07800, partial [Terrimicrobiaceae bacterium]|nr:hypothetical protein [Terrimicrobiaceae bacterium]